MELHLSFGAFGLRATHLQDVDLTAAPVQLSFHLREIMRALDDSNEAQMQFQFFDPSSQISFLQHKSCSPF